MYHILRDRRTLVVIIAAAGAAGDHFRLRDPDRREHVRLAIVDPAPDYGDAGAPQPLRGRRRVHHRRGRCRASSARAAVPARRRAGGGGLRAGSSPSIWRRGTAGAAADHHRRDRAEHRQRRPGLRDGRHRGLRARAAGARGRRRPHRARGPDALQSDARELEPLRARPDGVRPDDHLVADDRHLAHAREGDRHAWRRCWSRRCGRGRSSSARWRRTSPSASSASSACIVEARLVFNVPLRGSLVLLLAEGVLFILVSLSLGILVSARTSSQRVAMMGAMVGTMLPTMLLSGFIFPLESMPRSLQASRTSCRRGGSCSSRAASC